MIFVDTGAWYACFVKEDPNYTSAAAWLAENTHRLVTTDFVLDELFTLLRIRGQSKHAYHLGPKFLRCEFAAIERITVEDFENAWNIFQSFHDKLWSFTDCTSYVVMQRLNVQKAFSFDEHFRQFGTVIVVP